MKHLIKTADSSSLAAVNYNRVILNTTTDNVTIDYSYVDLGLPSGLKWATRNIGATSESDYGDFFMWGSTTPNTASQCNWSNAPFNNKASDYDSTYFNSVKGTVCPNDVLAKDYDTATQIMGGDWRMPTKADFDELLSGTTNEWIEDYNGTGVSGRKFISKTDTSKYIFIPAAGGCYNGSVNNVGDNSYVWSSSLGTSDPNGAWYLSFYSGNCGVNSRYRCYGQSVRGVRK